MKWASSITQAITEFIAPPIDRDHSVNDYESARAIFTTGGLDESLIAEAMNTARLRSAYYGQSLSVAAMDVFKRWVRFHDWNVYDTPPRPR